MHVTRALVAALSGLALVACGGGGGGSGSGAGAGTPSTALETGPGDSANHFPDSIGDTWHYNDWTSGPLGDRSVALTTLAITGTRAVLGQQAVVLNHRIDAGPVLAGVPTVMDAYYAERPGGVLFLGTDDASDALGAAMVPYPVLLFPVTSGPIATVERSDVDYGADLDGDGIDESAAIVLRSGVAGFDSVAVPAGRFADVARVVTDVTVTLTLSRDRSRRSVTSSETAWVAPNAGPIKSLSRIGDSVNTAWEGREARGLRVGARQFGLSNPFVVQLQAGPLNRTDVAVAPSATDRPAVASSGTDYLVVSRQYVPAPSGYTLRRILTRVAADAEAPMPSVQIGPPVACADTLERNAIAFGGGVYLVVSEQRDPGPSPTAGSVLPSIVAQRARVDGTPIDPAPIQLVPPSEPPYATDLVTRHVGVAFGAGRFLAIYHGGPPQTPGRTTHVEGRFVSPDGVPGAAFRITPDFVHGPLSPVVGFDGVNFVVGWNEGGQDGAWKLVRVAPSGDPIEPALVLGTVPSVPLALAASDAGVLVSWIEGYRVHARRFDRALSALDASPIDLSGPPAPIDRNAVQVARFQDDYLVAWSETLSTTMAKPSQWVVRMQRIGIDGVLKNAPHPTHDPIGATMTTGFLASAVPDRPCCGHVSGFVLPALATGGSDTALLVYAEGTSSGATFEERAGRVRGVRIHPFAK